MKCFVRTGSDVPQQSGVTIVEDDRLLSVSTGKELVGSKHKEKIRKWKASMGNTIDLCCIYVEMLYHITDTRM